jgi:exodeoxyribonuclease-3
MADSLSLITWNVNSLRARMEHVTRWLGDHGPDVVCLQETKVADELFPLESLESLGYQVTFAGQKAYNGVAILSRSPISDVYVGFHGDGREEQKRLIAGTIEGIRVVNAYVPQGSEVESPKFSYKLEFIGQLAEYFERLHQPDEQVVLVGDFNVATEPGDVFDPEEMEGKVCCHPAEREALQSVKAWGFHDQFRKFEAGAGFYTWWDYRQGAFRRNRGLRIDHIWATEPLSGRSRTCWIDREERTRERASDHVPVVATFERGMD